MKDYLIIRILFIFTSLFFIVFPVELLAVETDTSILEIEPSEIYQSPKRMTQKEMNDLFGEDPYLGQTSYLQSPDGFNQRKN